MKPRTKFEKAVIAQSGHLRPLPTAPQRWAFLNTIDHYAFRLPKVALLVWTADTLG